VNKSSETPGDSLNLKDQEFLARYSINARLRYKDPEAGYCTACGSVYGVTCPKCKAVSGVHGFHDADLFRVDRPIETVRSDGFNWVVTECAKCDFRFRVIVQPFPERI
jgi:hypothetical protein